MQPYTYHLYHKPTGKHYYGVRTKTGCHPDELWKTYFSSSKVVKSLREQYGDDSFEFQIRKTFETPREALEWETRLLTRIDAAGRDEWLNRHNGGKKFSTSGIKPSVETVVKRKEKLKKLAERPEWREKMRKINKEIANNPIRKEKFAKAIEEKMKNDEWRQKMKEVAVKRAQKSSWKERNKLAREKLYQDPIWHENLSKALKERAQDPEWKRKNKEQRDAMNKDPEVRRKRSEAMKRYHANKKKSN
jgi:hypothetical protein